MLENKILKEKSTIKKELLNKYNKKLNKKWLKLQDEMKKWNKKIKKELEKIDKKSYDSAKKKLIK